MVVSTTYYDSTTEDDIVPLRVAIIGAGVGGLTLAVSLAKMISEKHIQIDVYEQAQNVNEVGAGIVIWPRTWEIMEHLGVDGALSKHLGYTPDNEKKLVWTVKKCDQEQSRTILEFYHEGGTNRFHRADVQESLLSVLPPYVHVHLGHRLSSYEEEQDKIILTFANGVTRTYDLLVGADGIKSLVRAQFIPKRIPHQVDSIDPIWGGTIAYRSLLDPEIIKKRFPDHPVLSKFMMYAGDGMYVVTYPISQGYVNFAAMVTDYTKEGTRYEGPTTKPVTNSEVTSHFKGWSEEVTSLFDCMKSSSQWAFQYINPLEVFAAGRVVLVGDAAHAMTPNLGSGAGQAIEDAYILSNLLRKSIQSRIPIQRVTEVYTKVRQPLANLVLEKSHAMGRLVCFREPGYEGINGADDETVETLMKKLPEDFKEMYQWWETHPVIKEVEKALAMLDQIVAKL